MNRQMHKTIHGLERARAYTTGQGREDLADAIDKSIAAIGRLDRDNEHLRKMLSDRMLDIDQIQCDHTAELEQLRSSVSVQTAMEQIDMLTAERDKWKERCVARGRDLRVITAERDRWKGMVARLVAAEDRWQETSMNGDLEILYDEFCCARRLLGE